MREGLRFHVEDEQPAVSLLAAIRWKDADAVWVGRRDYDVRVAVGNPLRDFLAYGAPPRTGVGGFRNQTAVGTA